MADSSIMSVSTPQSDQLPTSGSASSLLDETEPSVLLQDETAVLSGETEGGPEEGNSEEVEQEQDTAQADAPESPPDEVVTSPSPAAVEEKGEWSVLRVGA